MVIDDDFMLDEESGDVVPLRPAPTTFPMASGTAVQVLPPITVTAPRSGLFDVTPRVKITESIMPNQIPTWVWWALGAVVAFAFFRRPSRRMNW